MTEPTHKLLPCPFCGAPAAVERDYSVDFYGWWWCGCPNDECAVRPFVHGGPKDDARAHAIAAWNRRTRPEGKG